MSFDVLLVLALDLSVYACIPVYGCGCMYVCMRVCVRDVILFTQVAVSARQSLSAAVNLWLIYLSPSLYLVDCNYSLCTSVFPQIDRI